MKSKFITIGFGKKDFLLSNWWNDERNQAKRELTLMALEHYIRTGNYLCIGEIVPKPEVEKKNDKMVLYTTQSVEVSDWIALFKREKGSRYIANEIRRILYNSIKQCKSIDEEKWYSPYEELEEINKAPKRNIGYVVDNKQVEEKECKEVKSSGDTDTFAASLLNSIVKDNKGKMKKTMIK